MAGTTTTMGSVGRAVLAVRVAVVFLLVCVGALVLGGCALVAPSGAGPETSQGVPTAVTSGPANESGLPGIAESELPPEAWDTLDLIRQGGPFPYDRDGLTFRNSEGLLPAEPRGYYSEYTVITPGESDRGARRIVVGDGAEKYYTADHYSSFEFIEEGR